jgi:large subunit ribosomal protein L25
MATILDLSAEKRQRTGTGAMGRLRKEGLIPAVLYGRTHASAFLKVNTKIFTKIVEHSASENILVNLKIDGEAAEQLALVQEVQHDHLKGGILHVDFHAIAADEEIHAEVPVNLTGTPVGIKAGGLLEYIHHNLEVRCLPKFLPDALILDVTHLNVGESVHVRDIPLPEGVRTNMGGDVVIALIAEPKVEAEPAPGAAAAAAAPAKAAAGAKAPAAPAAAAAPAKKK